MNGFEFVKKIRGIRPGVKVFLMTAFESCNDAEFRKVLPDVKIECLMQKPISLAEFNTTVIKYIP